MKALLDRLHARMGDLWWYSLMIFVACRSGDAINAFIGLWLVPKYVGPGELGAVLPIQQLTSFLTVPLGIVAIVFSKYVNTYAAHGEYGKVKGFIRDVLAISAALFVVCIGGAYLVMPFFYERLNIAPGLLTALILAGGFVGAIGSLVGAAQQGLKRFKMMTWMNLIGSPIRLVTMLVAMPIRALSGYMLGQTTPGVVTTTLSALDVKKALTPYKIDHTWRKDWKSILQYTWPIATFTVIGIVTGTIFSTVIRQRIPEVESAAYYLLTRFAEITGYITSSMAIVLFPMASEAHEKGNDARPLLYKTTLIATISTLLLAVFFAVIAKPLLSFSAAWRPYLPYAKLLPVITIFTGAAAVLGAFITYANACRHFKTLSITYGLSLFSTIVFVALTGFGHFRGFLPDAVIDYIAELNFARLSVIMTTFTIWNIFQVVMFIVCDKLWYRVGNQSFKKTSLT